MRCDVTRARINQYHSLPSLDRTRVHHDNTRIDGRAAVISEYDYARDGKKCDMSWKLEGTNIFGGE